MTGSALVHSESDLCSSVCYFLFLFFFLPSTLATNRINFIKTSHWPLPSALPLPHPSPLNQSVDLNTYPLNQFSSEICLAVSPACFKNLIDFHKSLVFLLSCCSCCCCCSVLWGLHSCRHSFPQACCRAPNPSTWVNGCSAGLSGVFSKGPELRLVEM